jgi:hypothetical protein
MLTLSLPVYTRRKDSFPDTHFYTSSVFQPSVTVASVNTVCITMLSRSLANSVTLLIHASHIKFI